MKEEVRKLSRVQNQQQPPSSSPSQKSPQPNHTQLDARPKSPISSEPPRLIHSPSENMRSSRASMSSVSGNSVKEEEEINLEYLRNVIIKFLESKSTRAQLIPVLSMMLKFTPEEVKRLNHVA